ncbi:hypothetical protein RJT34_25381 [Clitoria ternatea]|uniref:Uncharacterized protein n=1 Tax=Clitoria ternatea TaxID=43366 RepID=A0AAN9FWG3_CLITE
MDRKVKPLYLSAFLVLLCLQLHFLSGIATRSLEARKLDSSGQRMWAMMHSGPSHGGKGHKFRTQNVPIPKQLKESAISPGLGH